MLAQGRAAIKNLETGIYDMENIIIKETWNGDHRVYAKGDISESNSYIISYSPRSGFIRRKYLEG